MRINEVIIVEGKTDSDKLKNYFDVKTIICNGSAISKQTLNLIKETSLNYSIIVFTDPDYQGEKIRRIINEYLDGNCMNAFIDKKLATKGKKVGIAQASKRALIDSLKKVITFNNDFPETISWTQYLALNLNDKKLRAKICYYFNISLCNNKTLWKRLNLMNQTYKQIKLILKEKSDEN